MKLSTLILLALAGTFATAAAKDGTGSGSSTPNPGMPQERRIGQDVSGSVLNPTRDAAPAFQIDGTVEDGGGGPLGGVVVKLFNNGVVAASAKTAADGSFRIEANPLLGGNNSSVLWFQSPDPERLLDVQAVLSEGQTARETGLFPRCVQRVEILGSHATVAVRLMTPDEKKAVVEQSKCLEAGS
jgi:hypothetical protein